jgi:hypothetical protein
MGRSPTLLHVPAVKSNSSELAIGAVSSFAFFFASPPATRICVVGKSLVVLRRVSDGPFLSWLMLLAAVIFPVLKS